MSVRIGPNEEPIPGYRLIERLGRGGFGEVWKAEAPGGLLKAIKFVYGDLEGAGEGGQPAEQELKSLARVKTIRHPYILSLERFDIIDGQLVIVMELADQSLWDRFRHHRAQNLPGVPRDELLRYMEEAAEALDLMNLQYHLQHLDIKPQNLFLVYNHVKVADFGLAKDFEGHRATATGGVTPVYAAPETFEGYISRFSDQYSLAIVYQELLTGQRPFNGTNTRHLMLQHMNGTPDLSSLPAGDRPTIERALSKKPDDRWPTCMDMVQRLKQASNAPAPPPPRPTSTISERSTPGPGSSGVLTQPSGGAAHAHPGSPNAPTGEGAVPLRGLRTASGIFRVPGALTEGPKIGPVLTQARMPGTQTATFASGRQSPTERTGAGPILPAVIVGLGGLGLRVLKCFRQAMADRFGPHITPPNVPLIYFDTDPDAITDATAGPPQLAILPRQVIHARLNRPGHYVKPREGVPPVEKWIDPVVLHSIPRNPVTEGKRALGRLAFCDHYRAFAQRLRTDIEIATAPGSLEEAEKLTGLALRTTRPRVYIVASLAGGTGSGVFIDAAYVARNLLRQAGSPQPEVIGVLLLPWFDRNSPRMAGSVNAFAALTELYHFSTPQAAYETRLDTKEPVLFDPDRPFSRCILLQLPKSSEETELSRVLGLAGGWLFRELFSLVGRAAETARNRLGPAPEVGVICHSIGMFSLTWPRQALLEATIRRFAQRLLQQWMAKESGHLREAVQNWVADQWSRRRFDTDVVIEQLQSVAEKHLSQPAENVFDALVSTLSVQGVNKPKLDATAAVGVLDQLLEIVGKPDTETTDERPGQLKGVIQAAAKKLVSECDNNLNEMARFFIEEPSYRIAGAEEALRQVSARLDEILTAFESLHSTLTREVTEAYARMFPLIGRLAGFILPAQRSAITTELLELLRVYPRKRYQELILGSALTVYRTMKGAIPELMRDVNYCRLRLQEVVKAIEQTTLNKDGTPRVLGPGRYLFPPGCKSLEEAADFGINQLTGEEVLEFDQMIQSQIRKQFKSLISAILDSNDFIVPLRDLVYQQSEQFMQGRVANANPASVFLEHYDTQAASREISSAHDEAAPELFGPRPKPDTQIHVLSTPNDAAGEKFRSIAVRAMPEVMWEHVTDPSELLFMREQTELNFLDLPHLNAQARDGFRQQVEADGFSAYSRIDVNWIPAMKSDG